MAEQAQGPLGGIKALDVTMNLSGPAAAKHLADSAPMSSRSSGRAAAMTRAVLSPCIKANPPHS